ncbi:hypothetical protein LV779_32925 [Streptomyces thinghirensis]|nr:hypothetical protein [Streptomyces thinghirensis]
MGEHPWLEHHLTLSDDGCTATGTTGQWNKPHRLLRGLAAGRVRPGAPTPGSPSRCRSPTSPTPAAAGAASSPTRPRWSSAVRRPRPRAFETALGAWRSPGRLRQPRRPQGLARTGTLFQTYGAVTTDDTVLLGFGPEHSQ